MAPVKRALSSYMIFCNDRRKKVADANPGASASSTTASHCMVEALNCGSPRTTHWRHPEAPQCAVEGAERAGAGGACRCVRSCLETYTHSWWSRFPTALRATGGEGQRAVRFGSGSESGGSGERRRRRRGRACTVQRLRVPTGCVPFASVVASGRSVCSHAPPSYWKHRTRAESRADGPGRRANQPRRARRDRKGDGASLRVLLNTGGVPIVRQARRVMVTRCRVVSRSCLRSSSP